MRNPSNCQVYAQGTQHAMLYVGRGYTGHEHLNQFGLVNMNARLYDPLLARSLAPDPFVGSGMTNDFNRYIYCLNNPLMFTDPSGKSIKSFFQNLWGKFSDFMNKTFPNGFEVGFGQGLPGSNGGGFFYNGNLNGNSSFHGNYNPNNGIFTMESSYNGYQASSMTSSQYGDPASYQMSKAIQSYMQENNMYMSFKNSYQYKLAMIPTSLKTESHEERKNGSGYVISLANVTGAFLGGGTLDTGAVIDKTGDTKMYLTIGATLGFGTSAGTGAARTNNDFQTDQFGGYGSNINFTLPFMKNTKPFSFDWFGDSGNGILPGNNYHGIGGNFGVGVGYFKNWTYTFLFPLPSTDIWTRISSRR